MRFEVAQLNNERMWAVAAAACVELRHNDRVC